MTTILIVHHNHFIFCDWITNHKISNHRIIRHIPRPVTASERDQHSNALVPHTHTHSHRAQWLELVIVILLRVHYYVLQSSRQQYLSTNWSRRQHSNRT